MVSLTDGTGKTVRVDNEAIIVLRWIPKFNSDDDAPNDLWSIWGLGVAISSLVAIYGVSCVLSKHAILMGRFQRRMVLSGDDAIAYGLAVIAAALFLNAHYFWSNSTRLAEYAGTGKIVSLLSGILCIGFVIVRNIAVI